MISALLDRPIAYHRALAAVAGGVAGGVFLSQLIYWQKRSSHPQGWVYKAADQWQEETFLTADEQRTARKRLVKTGILQETYAYTIFEGFNKFDKRLCFKVDFAALEKCFSHHNWPETPVVVEVGKIPNRATENPSSGAGKSQIEQRKIPVHCTQSTAETKTQTTPPGGGGVDNFLKEVARSENLTAAQKQILEDATAGALGLPLADKRRPKNLKKWLAATAEAIKTNEFVETDYYLAARAARQAKAAVDPDQQKKDEELRERQRQESITKMWSTKKK